MGGIFNFIVLNIVFGLCTSTEICPSNEEFSNCTQIVCRPQICPQRGKPVACTAIAEEDCQQGYVCVSGTLRNSNGECVPEDQCEGVCPPGEELSECIQTECRAQDCTQIGLSLACPSIEPCDCISGCVCPKGFVRDENSICIPEGACPGQVCSTNEEFYNCTLPICRPLDCFQRDQPIVCQDADVGENCESGCVCKAGFLRTIYGDCVPEDRCYGQLVCDENESVETCPGNCSDFCPTNYDDEICSLLDPTPNSCGEPMCKCKFNYKRDKDSGTCIPISDCPTICAENEEYSNCIQAVCQAKNCNQKNQPIECPIILDGACQEGCVCVAGTLRDENGNCIPEDQCPGVICGENEMLNNCPNGCDNDSCNQRFNYPNDCIAPAVCLPPQCQCIQNYARDDSGTCIPVEDCPVCPSNEVYSNCTQAECRALNCFERGQPIACSSIEGEACASGCICQVGYLRTADGDCVPEDRCYGDLVCDENETVNTCPGSCINDFCPTSENSEVCPTAIFDSNSDSCGQPMCVCRFNYKRNNDNGSCIPARDCPPFDCSVRPNEEYNSCPPMCPTDDCSQATPSGRCPFPGRILIILECKAKCRCIDGYWRNDGICVPYAECPGVCPENEVLSDCSQALCSAQNCSQINQPIACPSIAEGYCQQGCVCVPGTLRDENGNCIPENQCSGQILCGENETFNECPSVCTTDACPINFDNIDEQPCSKICGTPRCECVQNYKRDANGNCIPIEECPSICGENEEYNECTSVCFTDACPTNFSSENTDPCILICGPPKCECIANYRRDDTGKCIPIENCPGICPVNEEYSSCTQALCRAQNCSQINQSIPCPRIAEGYCQQGCVCVPGTLRDKNGNCIPEYQCPAPICGENEEYNECTSVCFTDACPTNLSNENPRPCILICGPPKCECIANYRRDDTGKCIPIEDCPGICPVNEEYCSCVTASLCRSQYCAQDGQESSCSEVEDECQQGCVCVQGTLRDENGFCIPEDKCPAEQICGKNEVYNECPSLCKTDACPTSTDDYSDYEEACIDVCAPPKCECISNYARDAFGNCIPIEDYPQQCSAPNEVLSCVQACPPEKTCRNREILISCLYDENPCQQKCVCKEGYFRNAIGECITGDECDLCQGKHEFFSCGQECDTVCGDTNQNRTNCRIINIQCNRQCYCEDGFARDGNKNCIPLDECPKGNCSDPNEEFRTCKQTCPPDSCLSLVARFKCSGDPICEPGCSCKPGFLRQNDSSACMPMCDCTEMKNSLDCQKSYQ